MALWQVAVSPTSERGGGGEDEDGGRGREKERRRGGGVIHSLCAQSAVEITQGNETPDTWERRREGGGRMVRC